MGELGADNTGVSYASCQPYNPLSKLQAGLNVYTVRTGDPAPDHSDLAATDLLGSLVDVGDLLAEVEAVSSVSSQVPS